jgi:hypothetical protein
MKTATLDSSKNSYIHLLHAGQVEATLELSREEGSPMRILW